MARSEACRASPSRVPLSIFNRSPKFRRSPATPEHAQSRSRHFQREWQTVEMATDFTDIGAIVVTQLEQPVGGARPLNEKINGAEPSDLGGTSRRHFEWREAINLLGDKVQILLTCRQH